MFLFVYGPYMNPKYLHERGIEIIGSKKASLYGYDICFSTQTGDWKKAMVDIVETPGKRIEGVVYEVSESNMKIFDGLEKLSEGRHRKIGVGVTTWDGNAIEALTFICPKKEGNFAPSKEYIDIIVEGAKINNLSLGYIEYLKSFIRV